MQKILFIFVLFLVGFGAYFLWEKQLLKRLDTNPQLSVISNLKENFFLVPELGIKFKISDNIRDLVYIVRNENGQTGIFFSTLSLTNLDKQNGGVYCAADKDGIAVLGKSNQIGHDISGYKQIGTTFYNWSLPQATCSSKKVVYELQLKQAKSLGEAFQTISPIDPNSRLGY